MAVMRRCFAAPGTRVLLDVKGRQCSSEDLAGLIGRSAERGGGIGFLIGGPNGVPSELEDLSTDVIALSRCTFPHKLFRVILLEQLYRAFTIIKGEPYHRS